jgi:KDO2-lipid IV(A) lauroyltransferase
MPFSKQLKRGLTVFLTRTLVIFLNIIPRRVGIFIFNWIGLAAWWLDVKDRQRINRHLTLVYGNNLTESKKREIGRSFFVNSARNFVDVVRMQRHYRTQIAGLIDAEGMAYFDQAYKAGKGLIGITGHIGNFELLAVYLAAQGYAIGVIGRKLYDERMDNLLVGNRESLGLTNFYTTDSPRRMLKWLNDGRAIGVLMDTDSHRVSSMLVPSFNRLSYTPVGHIRLALRTGAALVPLFCIRQPGDRYKVVIKPPIEYDPGTGSEEDIRRVTLQCNQVIDQFIDEHRDQWIWLHNRWHTSPEAAANY